MKAGKWRFLRPDGLGNEDQSAISVGRNRTRQGRLETRTDGNGNRYGIISGGNNHGNPGRRGHSCNLRQRESAKTKWVVMMAVLIFFMTGALSTIDGTSLTPVDSLGKISGNVARDTIPRNSNTIPLGKSTAHAARPRFETVHLVLGFGPMFSDFSDLEKLGIEKSDLTMPLSLYIHVPFLREDPTFYFLGGWDLSTNSTFKAFLMLQTDFRLLFGLGVGSTTSKHEDEEASRPNFNASRTYGVAALGVNIIPQVLDLMLTVPLGASLSTNFENQLYSIRPAGIHVSLQVSLL